jgi:hypothetical protein
VKGLTGLPQHTSSPTPSESRWHIAPALAGWLLPGLGHWLIGQRRRGGVLMLTLLLLWAAGLTVGGISVIDHERQRWWFLGQMLMAPSVAVDFYHQRLKPADQPLPRPKGETGQAPPYRPSFGHQAEQGTLYVALAGLLNLVAMLDVVYREPEEARHQPPEVEPDAGAATKFG